MSKEQAGKAYLAAVAPANDAIKTFNKQSEGLDRLHDSQPSRGRCEAGR
jgi:hypothetical protein